MLGLLYIRLQATPRGELPSGLSLAVHLQESPLRLYSICLREGAIEHPPGGRSMAARRELLGRWNALALPLPPPEESGTATSAATSLRAADWSRSSSAVTMVAAAVAVGLRETSRGAA